MSLFFFLLCGIHSPGFGFVGLHVFPGIGAYCMSKHATTALANILRYELSQWRVTVHDIQPGFFR
jgi:NAD(P)-dependent dehydrogenase (short-subunit alcohol dehydrogenase family)